MGQKESGIGPFYLKKIWWHLVQINLCVDDIPDTIHAGANLMLMCAQIASKIELEQNKTLWVSSGTIW